MLGLSEFQCEIKPGFCLLKSRLLPANTRLQFLSCSASGFQLNQHSNKNSLLVHFKWADESNQAGKYGGTRV